VIAGVALAASYIPRAARCLYQSDQGGCGPGRDRLHFGESPSISAVYRDARASLRKQPCDSRADPRRTAGHPPHLAIQTVHADTINDASSGGFTVIRKTMPTRTHVLNARCPAGLSGVGRRRVVLDFFI
jgi:hypothetical protein